MYLIQLGQNPMFWNRDRKGWVTSEQATRYKTKAVACLAKALLPTGAKVIENPAGEEQ